MREIKIQENIPSEKLKTALEKVKSELINNKRDLLIEKIKKTIIEYVYYSEKQIKTNFSLYLSQKLDYHYAYMAYLFTKVHGSSIQNFIITTKIERVKELLIYDKLTLTEIASKLHYSSVSHLSNQFKKITGKNPSSFLASLEQSESLLQHHTPKVFHTYSDEEATVSYSLNTTLPPDNDQKPLRLVSNQS